MDKTWRQWTKENLERGCSADEVRDILLANHFSISEVRTAMGGRFEHPLARVSQARSNPEAAWIRPDYVRLYRSCSEQLLKLPESQRLGNASAPLFAMAHFLTDKACDALTEICREHCRDSDTDNSAGATEMVGACDLAPLKHSVIRATEAKISASLGIRPDYSEGMRAQRFRANERYKARADYFDPENAIYDAATGKTGNRTWTVMICIEAAEEGGGIGFAALDAVCMPKKGEALAWNNLGEDGTPNAATRYGYLPITNGETLMVVQRFRERGHGAMFYTSSLQGGGQ